MQNFVWEETNDVKSLVDILNYVEPHEMERNAILKCVENNIVYKCFVAKNKEHKIVALIIATFLPQSQTLHIEDYAIHPLFRGQGHARKLWNDWRDLVRCQWTTVEALTIEVYLHNVEVWRNIMGISELFPHNYELDLAPGVLVSFMGTNLTCSPEHVIKEWKKICNETNKLLSKL